MPTIRIPLHGIELRSDLITQISTLLQPAAREEAARVLALEESRDPAMATGSVFTREELIAGARQDLEAGGIVAWPFWTVISREGIQYKQQSMLGVYDAPAAALIDGARTASLTAQAGRSGMDVSHSVHLEISEGYGTAEMTAPENEVRQLSEQLERFLRDYQAEDAAQQIRPFKVFIAFGGSDAWEVVRDYLRRADIEVDAFNEAERVGEVTIDVVSQMIHSSSVAVIVMTAAEEVAGGGRWFARQNVIHETGFAQAVLGVRDTIILLEEGVELPSNLANVTYIPFPRGSVHKTEQRVVARIRETKADFEGNWRSV